MESSEFVAELLQEMADLFEGLEQPQPTNKDATQEIVELLRLALVGELEASEVAGSWLQSTPEIEAKSALAMQCGDEMRHYKLIANRLAELGDDLSDFDPLEQGHSPLYQYLLGLRSTPERVAAGLFTGEAIAVVRNRQFMTYCRSIGDDATADLYQDLIHPEEIHHHELGRDLLLDYAIDEPTQDAVRAAVRNTLAISDELRELKEKVTGMPIVPVS